jgi:hypothetical protein
MVTRWPAFGYRAGGSATGSGDIFGPGAQAQAKARAGNRADQQVSLTKMTVVTGQPQDARSRTGP